MSQEALLADRSVRRVDVILTDPRCRFEATSRCERCCRHQRRRSRERRREPGAVPPPDRRGVGIGNLDLSTDSSIRTFALPTIAVFAEPTIVGLKQVNSGFRAGAPDLRAKIDVICAPGYARLTWKGTHSGELLGMPATGRRLSATEFEIVQCRDGRSRTGAHRGACLPVDGMSHSYYPGAPEHPAVGQLSLWTSGGSPPS
jgi:SnoaL-like polyketide cyclase